MLRALVQGARLFRAGRLGRLRFIVLAVTLGSAASFAENGQLELRVKSAFIYNFTKFITWPESNGSGTSETLRICVAKADEVFELVDETVTGKTTQGRNVEVHHLRDRTEASRCQLVYVRNNQLAQEWRAEMDGAGLVTVGEGSDFVDNGGIFGFIIVDKKIRFEINLAVAESKGLKISSKLLSLAQRVVY